MKTLMTLPGPGQRKRGRSSALRVLVVIVVALVAYPAFFAVSASRRSYPLAAAAGPATSPRGAYHVHSTLSHDGRGSPEEIAQAAKAAGLHFVIFTEHNPAELFAPRYDSGVLLIGAQELSTPNGHVVALGTSRVLTEEERKGDVFGTIASLGGVAFLPHPEQQKNPWRDWPHADRARGLELYSADSMFRDAQKRPFTRFIPAAASWLTNGVHGLLQVVHAQPELEKRMLEVAARQPYAALCAHDAHGMPSYESEFRTLAVYLPPLSGGPALPQDPNEAAAHVISELAQGHAWCAFQGIAAGDGFELSGLAPDSREARVGATLTVQLPGATPKDVQVRVTGPAALGADGRSISLTGEGAVQVEVWAKVPGMFFDDGWRPWLVASPIRVTNAPAPVAQDGGAPDAGP